MDNKELVREIGRKVKDGLITWQQGANEFTKLTGIPQSADAFRSRYRHLKDIYEVKSNNDKEKKQNTEYETHNEDGTIDICKEMWFDANEDKTPETILKKFGYNINEWEVISWTFGKWEVAIKEEEQNRVCTTIRAKIRPIVKKDLPIEEYLKIAKEVFGENIKPLKVGEYKPLKGLDKNKLMELTGIELHLGKMAWNGDTGQDYDKNIAQDRFYTILEETVREQQIDQCDTCLLCIGNDFFNSDTVNATTTKGTPQTNDLRWKKMFNLGLDMYVRAIETLKPLFNQMEIRLQSGNHDTMASFYLYIALSCYYKNDSKVHFVDNYKNVQCFEWGKCAIFFSHGDTNLKRLIKSIPCEFYKEWGRSIFRELHLGHLHSEIVVDDQSGMITRRVGSPTGTDQWHYEERFIGATQKYQVFVWDKEKGLQNIKYINFENNSKKKLLKHEYKR